VTVPSAMPQTNSNCRWGFHVAQETATSGIRMTALHTARSENTRAGEVLDEEELLLAALVCLGRARTRQLPSPHTTATTPSTRLLQAGRNTTGHHAKPHTGPLLLRATQ